jgi:putative MATE family efflux protein
MGGHGASLDAALAYSGWVFSGAVLVWLFNSLSAVIRGSGNTAVPAIVTCAGLFVLVPLSPALIFGWGPLPALGIIGGALALLVYYVLGCAALLGYLASRHSIVRPSLHGGSLRRPFFAAILRVGLIAALVTFSTNLAIAFTTGLVGRFGDAAIAGYGVGSRLEYLLVPLVFGLGSPLVTLVGTHLGAGQREQALRAAWLGAAVAFGMTVFIGLVAAAFPLAWLSLFNEDPAMLQAGSDYLRAVGPFYGFFGLGMALYFASQGAGRLAWPVAANLGRLAIGLFFGWLAWHLGGTLTQVFLAQSAALVVFGVVNVTGMLRGAWFTGGARTPVR